MAFQIVVNLIIAFMWMFVSESYALTSFVFGYILGIFLLYLLRGFIPDRFYMDRLLKIIQLIVLFCKELILSNIDIVKLVYAPKLDVEPGIFALPTELKSNWEITLLANLISLTPGTLTVAISNDNTQLYIHAMHIDNIEESINAIKDTFEKAIMEVTR